MNRPARCGGTSFAKTGIARIESARRAEREPLHAGCNVRDVVSHSGNLVAVLSADGAARLGIAASSSNKKVGG